MPRHATLTAFVFATVSVPAVAVPPPGNDAVTEQTAAQWAASADGGASTALFDDSANTQVGGWSVRLETNAPFDCRMWTPVAKNANWDCSGVSRVQFWAYAVNPNIGFQSLSPWVRLGSGASHIQFTPTFDLLNDARNNWLFIDIPLTGNSLWQRSEVGTVNMTDVDFLQIHADTWDAGFTLWIDGVNFSSTPPLPDGLAAFAGNARVTLSWLPYAASNFSHFAVYRSTAAFSSVSGMTPIATIASAAATGHVDNTAANGTRYWYAVTAVSTGGVQETNVTAVGPRTPRNETDLQVVYIERTPKYPRYDPIYSYYEVTEPSGFGPYAFTAATGLGSGQNAGTQRFPTVGSTVTYTAHVRNRGTNSVAGPISVSWLYDGAPIGSTNIAGPLAPDAVATTTITRVWDGQSHDITFTINLADARPGNNSLTDDTNAVGFLSYIDRTYFENFREETPDYPQAATEDFIDWLNRHMVRMNQMFADAGGQKRVRFDKLAVLGDFDPDPAEPTINYAIFPFRYRHADGTLRLSGYYSPSEDYDYGLHHEKAHQLGLIDLYRLDVPGSNNQVSGQGYQTIACLMHGVSPFFSDHSALAMNHWYSVAHGYFGQYLYKMPAMIRMRFVGFGDAPVEGATVKMYQKVEVPGQGEIIPNQIKAQGVTDADGIWTLPNVAINPALAPTTFAGDTLNANPFGYVAVVGTNGLLHFRIEKDGAVDYAWLDITEANVAYWQGQTVVATFDRQVAVGGPVQQVPPLELTELNAGDWLAQADGSNPQNTFVIDETTPGLVQVGAGSIKFVTDGGFDTWLRYPATFTAQWDLSNVTTLNIRLRTTNTNGGFQNGSPWIRIGDLDNNYYQYQFFSGGTPTDKLNETIGVWRTYSIPIDAPANPVNGWGRATVGSPSLGNIRMIEIHADTWGGGFNLWVDGLSFSPQPCIRGDFNADSLRDGRDITLFVDALLSGANAFERCAGDFNGNTNLDSGDVGPFVECLISGGTCP